MIIYSFPIQEKSSENFPEANSLNQLSPYPAASKYAFSTIFILQNSVIQVLKPVIYLQLSP